MLNNINLTTTQGEDKFITFVGLDGGATIICCGEGKTHFESIKDAGDKLKEFLEEFEVKEDERDLVIAKEREGQESFTIEESFEKGLVSEELKNVLGGIK